MMATEMFKELPFFPLNSYDLISELKNEHNILEENSFLLNYVNNRSTSSILNRLNFSYATETQFNYHFKYVNNNLELTVLCINIRSSNCHSRQLCIFLQMLLY
jgi:hypothetical protein